MCVLIREYVSEAMCYQKKMPLIFVILFLDIGQYFQTAKQKASKIKNRATLGYTKILYIIFSKYFRPLRKLVKAVDALQTTTTDRIPNILYFCLKNALIYNPFGSRTFFGSCKNSGNIRLPEI